MTGPPLMTDLGLLVIRLMLAVVGVFHGAQKLFGVFGGHGIRGFAGFLESLGVPFPTLAAFAAALSEFLGGLLLALGLFSRIALIPWAFTMYVAVLLVHRHAFALSANGMEYALTLAVVLTALILTGPGRYAMTPRI